MRKELEEKYLEELEERNRNIERDKKFKDYVEENVEIISCTIHKSSIQPGFYRPAFDVELSVFGRHASFVLEDNIPSDIEVASDNNDTKEEIAHFILSHRKELGDIIMDSDKYQSALTEYDEIFEKSREIKEKLNDEFDFDREEQGSLYHDYYEDDMIKVTETGRDYGVAAIVENLTNDDIVLFAEGDFILAQIEAGDCAELTIDQYEELKEFIEAEELEVKTAEEMEQEDRDLVSRYRGDER